MGTGQSTYELTPELLAIASDLHRRCVDQSNGGSPPDFDGIVAGIALLSMYGREAQVGDVRVSRRVDLVPTDLDGKRVMVLARQWPMLVFAQVLDVDAFVFAGVRSKNRVELYGWLPTPLIERLAVRWLERDGERVSYSHEVERECLFPMPKEFRFTDDCEHGDWAAWWDGRGWFCFGCQRTIVDASEQQRISKQETRLGFGVAAGAVAAGVERASAVGLSGPFS